MTKKEIAAIVESMVEDIAVANGGTIESRTIKVGGRPTESAVSVGGLFDLDACRGILGHALAAHREVLVNHMPGRKAPAPPAAAPAESNGVTPVVVR